MLAELSPEAWRWLDQAVEDLAAARRVAADPDLPPRLVAFLAHLAAEKALKGTLIARGIAVRRIHDLVALQASLPAADGSSIETADVDLLVPWNIAGRYPADLPEADRETAQNALRASQRILDTLRERLIESAESAGPASLDC